MNSSWVNHEITRRSIAFTFGGDLPSQRYDGSISEKKIIISLAQNVYRDYIDAVNGLTTTLQRFLLEIPNFDRIVVPPCGNELKNNFASLNSKTISRMWRGLCDFAASIDIPLSQLSRGFHDARVSAEGSEGLPSLSDVEEPISSEKQIIRAEINAAAKAVAFEKYMKVNTHALNRLELQLKQKIN